MGLAFWNLKFNIYAKKKPALWRSEVNKAIVEKVKVEE